MEFCHTGTIHGFSGVIVFFAAAPITKLRKAETVLQLFCGAVRIFGLSTRMRCDHGTETIEVAHFMLNAS